MNSEELDRLEQDLSAVAKRLGNRRSWEELGPRVRWALRRPTRNLVGTVGFIVGCVGIGFWVPSAWMVAGGLLMVVLPKKVRDVRERRRDTTSASEGDLFALYRHELELTGAGHFARAFAEVALALLFALVGVLAPDSRPGLVAAALLAGVAVVRVVWLLPRPYRALREFDQGEVEP